MDTKPSIKNFIIVILPAVLTIFIIFFLIMPQVKKSRVENRQNFEQNEDFSQEKVEDYIRENISELSPEKEVLGGKFYVTRFMLFENNKAHVEYEDGHVSYTANVVFEVKGDEIVINDFSTIPTNDTVQVLKDELPTSPKGKLKAIDCLPEQRNVDGCIEIYQPVCGQMQVECIKAPCDPVKQTFENSCKACANKRVISYTEGECMDNNEIKY